jgi:Tol biopolymer transport system component
VIDERWRLVKALFQAAIETPAADRDAFLAAATGPDAALRREVESLLASDQTAGSFLEHALEAGRAIVPPRRQIGPYEIVAFLGAGAMGEVYRARDTKLNRDIALKLLPPLFAQDPNRLARFAREAKLLAALNHPNIAAIYGFEDSAGVPALVLELVDGPTLADRIAAGPISADEVLHIGRQIADALEAAHEKGIVHRDLKPANVKIDRAGNVKILDFGLAKPAISDTGPPGLTASHDGLLLGTASYMSPEQARGQGVDTRTDIWAFGCVLYEMLTGELAFPGNTVSDTIAKILEREPDWSALPAATSSRLRRVMSRCLAKDPRQRMRDIGDVRIELGTVEDASFDPSSIGRASVLPDVPAGLWFALGTIAITVAVWAMLRPPVGPPNPLADARFVPLTNWEGAEEGAEISGDGRFVSFLADRDGEFDIWLSQIGTGHFTNLTKGVAPLAPAGSIVRKLGFSGDGSEIWFNPGSRQPLLLIPLTGGATRAFLAGGSNTPAWAPDGSRLAYFGKPLDGDDPMYVADRGGANPRQVIASGAGLHRNNPVWSLDGKWIYFVAGAEPQDETDVNIWRVRASGGTPEQLTSQHQAASFLAPIGGNTILFVAREEDGTGPWLWALDVERRHADRVASGVNQYTSVAASRDGRRLVATVANPSASLWQIPLSERVAVESDAKPYPLPVPTGLTVGPRFAGATLFYLSARGTSDGLWKVQDGSATLVWRHVDGPVMEPAAPSADGRRLAIVVREQGKRHLSIMSGDGTNVQALAPDIDIQGAAGQGIADWSPDGAWIVAGGRDALGPALFKIPVDGGAPVRLAAGKWGNPVWSPDGALIVYAGRSVVGQVTLRAVRPDGGAVDLPEVWVRPGGYRFLRDGSGLVYLPGIHARDFWILDLNTKLTRPLSRLEKRGTLTTFDIAPDGRQLVFDRSKQNSDVVLIERPVRP